MTVKAIIKNNKGCPKTNNKGESLIFIQYGHKGKSFLISTGIKINPDYWINTKEEVNNNSSINDFINNKKKDILNIAIQLKNRNLEPSVFLVKKELINPSIKGVSVQKIQSQIENYEKEIIKLKILLKSAYVKKYKEDGYYKIYKDSLGYARKIIEKRIKQKLPVDEKAALLIKTELELLKLKRALNKYDKK